MLVTNDKNLGFALPAIPVIASAVGGIVSGVKSIFGGSSSKSSGSSGGGRSGGGRSGGGRSGGGRPGSGRNQSLKEKLALLKAQSQIIQAQQAQPQASSGGGGGFFPQQQILPQQTEAPASLNMTTPLLALGGIAVLALIMNRNK